MISHTTLTLLILELNKMADSGRYDDLTIDEAYEQIDRGTVLEFLHEREGERSNMNYYLKDEEFRRFYRVSLQGLYGGYAGDHGRKWGVRNKGIHLLLAWTNELVQLGTGWKPCMDFDER